MIAGSVFALLVGAAFEVMLLSIADQPHSAGSGTDPDQMLIAANHLERLMTGQDRPTVARQASLGPGAGMAASVLLVVLFTNYLTRTIVRSVRRAGFMARQRASGDLAGRLTETGAAETDHNELGLLLQDQAALGRVATRVAHAASPSDIFAAVAREVGELLNAPVTRLLRFEPDGMATVVARWGLAGDTPVGSRYRLEGESVATSVFHTGRAAGMEIDQGASGSARELVCGLGVHFEVGSPVVVEGRLWGMIDVVWTEPGRRPAGIEGRLAQFTELVATAIANAESRAELRASRARVLAAADEARRRIERDLHDGTQQRLVAVALDLRLAEASVPSELVELRAQLSHVVAGLTEALDDLRKISRGLNPLILSRGGLGTALKALARRSSVPVELDLFADLRLPQSVEMALYYVVSEALTNVAKHAHASVVHVDLQVEDGMVHLSVRDDGVGGARPELGSGLTGLIDRIEALGGRIDIASPKGTGTTLVIKIPPAAD